MAAPEAEFDSTHWDAKNVMDSIVNVAEALNPESIGAASATDLAAEYNSSTEYKEGDCCIHEGHLFKRNNVEGSDTEWVSGHWTATTAVSGVVRYDTV